jgi:hypothetical protein
MKQAGRAALDSALMEPRQFLDEIQSYRPHVYLDTLYASQTRTCIYTHECTATECISNCDHGSELLGFWTLSIVRHSIH